jgi:hypothetical protein
MEYGVGLRIPSPTIARRYQRTQNICLRTLLSAPPNTSIAALHKLTAIAPFDFRCRELGYLTSARFHNATDASITGLHVYRRALSTISTGAIPLSLPRAMFRLNPLATEFRPAMLDHPTHPLNREHTPIVPGPLGKADRRVRRTTTIQQLDADTSTVAASIQVRDDGKCHEFLTAASKITRAQRVSITRWQLGMVASHQDCRKCATEGLGAIPLSRLHAFDCTGLGTNWRIAEALSTIPPATRFGLTPLDAIINNAWEKMEPALADMLVEAIDTMEVLCRGRERTEQGFWIAAAPAAAPD